MPRLVHQPPKLSRHSSGQAYVTLGSRSYYLGRYERPETQAWYERIVAAWRHGGASAAITVARTRTGLRLPDAPTKPAIVYPSTRFPPVAAIYFAWCSGVVVYVGQTKNLRTRLCTQHHAIDSGDAVSWLQCQPCDLIWWEAYYLALLRPSRNYPNQRSAHELRSQDVRQLFL